eukprot:scaffold533697_cov32-Prasinocladus_malaysianus.AAC.1
MMTCGDTIVIETVRTSPKPDSSREADRGAYAVAAPRPLADPDCLADEGVVPAGGVAPSRVDPRGGPPASVAAPARAGAGRALPQGEGRGAGGAEPRPAGGQPAHPGAAAGAAAGRLGPHVARADGDKPRVL